MFQFSGSRLAVFKFNFAVGNLSGKAKKVFMEKAPPHRGAHNIGAVFEIRRLCEVMRVHAALWRNYRNSRLARFGSLRLFKQYLYDFFPAFARQLRVRNLRRPAKKNEQRR